MTRAVIHVAALLGVATHARTIGGIDFLFAHNPQRDADFEDDLLAMIARLEPQAQGVVIAEDLERAIGVEPNLRCGYGTGSVRRRT